MEPANVVVMFVAVLAKSKWFSRDARTASRLPCAISVASRCTVCKPRFKSYRGASFRVVPCARWYAPRVMASLTGLLDQSAADNEGKHDNYSE